MKFVCVKALPLYDSRHVNRIQKMLQMHSTRGASLTCLTDDPYGIDAGIEIIPLRHKNLHTWWHKMQVFEWAQTQEDRICYIDLDTIITANIDPLCDYQGDFAILRDFMLGEDNYQSSIMLMRGGFGKKLCDDFFADPERAMHDYSRENAKIPGKWGDQTFIEHNHAGADILQDIYPGMFVSYKVDVAPTGSVPHGASVVCFHGTPRPFHFSSPLTDAWRVL